jgi:uncharacterized protein YdeI (YjbR/CyaY-like superfamily)
MKNKKIDASKLLLGAKKTVLKTVADEKKKGKSIETLISSIHSENKQGLPPEETKRTTIDIPKNLHKRINQRILDKDIPSMKEYFLNLALLDLGVD